MRNGHRCCATSHEGWPHGSASRGRLTDDELVEHYSGCVAYVQPSSDEGFGLQQLEALACGALPVVAAIPPVVDVVGEGAVLWAEPEATAIAAAMERAAGDPALVEDARRRNPARAAAFSWERTASAIQSNWAPFPVDSGDRTPLRSSDWTSNREDAGC